MEPNITQFTWLDIPGFIVKCIYCHPPPPPKSFFLVKYPVLLFLCWEYWALAISEGKNVLFSLTFFLFNS